MNNHQNYKYFKNLKSGEMSYRENVSEYRENVCYPFWIGFTCYFLIYFWLSIQKLKKLYDLGITLIIHLLFCLLVSVKLPYSI